jgi:membrane protein
VALLLTTVLGLVTGAALDLVIGWLRLGDVLAAPLTRAAGLAVMLVLDMLVAIGLFRVASGISMPRRALLQSAVLAGLGATVLRYFSSLLLGSVGRNPLLAPFAVVLGLFVWFYLLSQIYMAAAAWGAVAEADARAHPAAAEGRDGPGLRRRALRLRPTLPRA